MSRIWDVDSVKIAQPIRGRPSDRLDHVRALPMRCYLMQSFYLLLPSHNQIVDHEESILDIVVIVPMQAFQILAVRAQVSRHCSSVQLTLSSLASVDLSLSWFSTLGD
jgi:hypothetical protein